MAIDIARKKWKNHKYNSLKKGVNPLDFETYKQKIADAGIVPEQIGHAINQFNLARYTDSGDYTADSCRFVTVAVNLSEQRINGGTARMAEKKRQMNKFNTPGVAAQAAKLRGRTALTHPNIARGSAKTAAKLRGRTKETDLGRRNAAAKMNREYAFVSPDGVLHEGIGITDFAKKHGMLVSSLSNLRRGITKHHRGWRLATEMDKGNVSHKKLLFD